MSLYSFRIDDGVVTQGTMSTPECAAEWLTENFGGFWVDSETLAGVGWTWDETNGFQPPSIEE
jgi:hypothetical protein